MYDNNHLADSLSQASANNRQKIFAVLPDGSSLSYGDLFDNAERLASALVGIGLQPGDRVAVQVGKSITFIELYLGTIIAGGIFLPLNTDYKANELEYFIGDADPRVFVCDPDSFDSLSAIVNEKPGRCLLTLGRDGKTGSLVDAMQAESPGFQSIARSEKDLAAILYTSGTTGRSKGAMLTHQALASNAETLREYWHFTPEDRLIHALPLFHIHGLFVAVNITLCTGSALLFKTRFDADDIIQSFKDASVLMGVPTFYVRLLKHAGLGKQATAGMRLFVSGSAPLLSETHDLWREKTGHAILERYGMTETNMNTSNPYDGDRRAGTVGFPLPGVEIKIADPDNGLALADGEVGQLEVRGPNVFQGYWNMPEKTAEELREDGYFQTGDLGFRDQDGYIHIVGRSKDMIISGGYNVYPIEIEAEIDAIKGVTESAVIGLPHRDFGEGVTAIVVSKEDPDDIEQRVVEQLSTVLARYKIPKRVICVDELPRNTMGKVQKKALRDTYADLYQ